MTVIMDALIKSYSLPASYFIQPTDCDNVVQDIASLSLSPPGSVYSALKATVVNCQKDDHKWIRRLGYVERLATGASYQGNLTTVYALWLDSKSPVTFQSIKKTSYIVYRKMPHLRVCLGKHKGSLWWKEMETATLDIEEVHSSDDIQPTYDDLLQRSYNLQEGPLWRVRFIKLPRDDFKNTDSPYTYKYACVFGFHHNMSDGTTNMNFCNVFLEVLNNVLLKRPVDLKPTGRFAAPLHDQMSDDTKDYCFLTRIFLWRMFKSLLSSRCLENFQTHFPSPTIQEIGTKVICKEFDEVNTGRLLKRCKMEGVTLNSAFTAAANLSMYAMILEKDKKVRRTHFDCQQAVNMRRYWSKDLRSNSYGCHISMLDFQIPTFYEDMHNFWEYTRRVHKLLTNDLNVTKRAIKINPLSERLCIAIYINSILAKCGFTSLLDSHYCVTNMGNVSSLFSGEGEEVEVSRILRSVTCHFMQALCQHTLQTFRGKFYYSLDYYPHRMPVEIARTYASNLMNTLRTSIHTPN